MFFLLHGSSADKGIARAGSKSVADVPKTARALLETSESMVKGNSFEVTIGNNSGFPLFLKETIDARSIFSHFSNTVTGTCSRRNKLLFKEQYELFLVSSAC